LEVLTAVLLKIGIFVVQARSTGKVKVILSRPLGLQEFEAARSF
jgi:hypothetical protein